MLFNPAILKPIGHQIGFCINLENFKKGPEVKKKNSGENGGFYC
jgi:hypothetical protein